MPRFTRLVVLGALAVALLVLALPSGLEVASRPPKPVKLRGSDAWLDKRAGEIAAVAFLPRNHATDGSVDYTVELQRALDAAAGKTLLLPPFPVLVSPRAGSNHCLIATAGCSVVGAQGSQLVERVGAAQVLRIEGVDRVRLAGFAVRGAGRVGHGLAHGLVQITGALQVDVEGLTVEDGDADGIAVANASRVLVRGNRCARISKSAIYVNGCTDASIVDNLVEGGVGHTAPNGAFVGAAFQISSSESVICRGNVVLGGVGIGILCDALDSGIKPFGCVIEGNRIVGVRNPANMDASSGIRLQNLSADTATQTLVEGNSIHGCGVYGIYVENHGGSVVRGNTIAGSERSGIVVGSVEGLVIADNAIQDSGASGFPGCASIYLINDARDVVLQGNVMRNAQTLAASSGLAGVIDRSLAGGQGFDPRIAYGDRPPIDGAWQVGDRVYAAHPASGGSIGWVCTQAGSPGAWAAFGPIE